MDHIPLIIIPYNDTLSRFFATTTHNLNNCVPIAFVEKPNFASSRISDAALIALAISALETSYSLLSDSNILTYASASVDVYVVICFAIADQAQI